jgi:hypothetical protein
MLPSLFRLSGKPAPAAVPEEARARGRPEARPRPRRHSRHAAPPSKVRPTRSTTSNCSRGGPSPPSRGLLLPRGGAVCLHWHGGADPSDSGLERGERSCPVD